MSDKNSDGILDLDELQSLMKEGNPSMKDPSSCSCNLLRTWESNNNKDLIVVALRIRSIFADRLQRD
eukprot:4631462-Amphidinium_carterae.1